MFNFLKSLHDSFLNSARAPRFYSTLNFHLILNICLIFLFFKLIFAIFAPIFLFENHNFGVKSIDKNVNFEILKLMYSYRQCGETARYFASWALPRNHLDTKWSAWRTREIFPVFCSRGNEDLPSDWNQTLPQLWNPLQAHLRLHSLLSAHWSPLQVTQDWLCQLQALWRMLQTPLVVWVRHGGAITIHLLSSP